jgi:hypothetical protein
MSKCESYYRIYLPVFDNVFKLATKCEQKFRK